MFGGLLKGKLNAFKGDHANKVSFALAGAAGVMIEDQTWPKRELILPWWECG